MEPNLSPQMAKESLYDGVGGAYYSWSPSDFPVLAQNNVAGGWLRMEPRGFAMPHYQDCTKIGYVIHGSCIVGLVSPNAPEEKVVRIEKGDAIGSPTGGVSWWFNDGEDELFIVFLGETSPASIPGTITYHMLAGPNTMLGGFSTEFISTAYGLSEADAVKLVKSQTSPLLLKLKDGTPIPQPSKDSSSADEQVFKFGNALPDVDVKNGGVLISMTATRIPLLKHFGFSASLVRLDANAMLSPMYSADASVHAAYIVRGCGRIQIVGLNGKQALDAKLQAGHLVVVPKFFAAAIVADGEGIEFFSIRTSPQPVLGHLAGNTSVWKALPPALVQIALNVTPQFEQLFRCGNLKNAIIIPPQH